jgi:phytoene dehydrogenase-like protein
MARTISVKVPVASLIANIEAKIAEIDEAIASYPAKRKQYEEAQEAYKAKVAEFVANYVTNNVAQIGYDYDSTIRLMTRGNIVELEFRTEAIADFPTTPEQPKMPNQNFYYGREYVTPKAILEKNLRILKMTSQEEVNASTYGAIMELL